MADVWFGHERHADGAASGDPASALALGYEPGMVAWVGGTDEGAVAVDTGSNAGLDLRDLLGGSSGGQEPVQLNGWLADLGRPMDGAVSESAAVSSSSGSPTGVPEDAVQWSAAVGSGEDRLLQELLNPNKLDNGC
jgi:hypothetical protein